MHEQHSMFLSHTYTLLRAGGCGLDASQLLLCCPPNLQTHPVCNLDQLHHLKEESRKKKEGTCCAACRAFVEVSSVRKCLMRSSFLFFLFFSPPFYCNIITTLRFAEDCWIWMTQRSSCSERTQSAVTWPAVGHGRLL